MSFETLSIIRGITVSEQELRVLIGKRFIPLWEDWVNWQERDDNGFSCWLEESELQPVKTIQDTLKYNLFSWPKCSDLYGKRYIIGTCLQKYTPEDTLNRKISIETGNSMDEKLKHTCQGYDILGEVEMILLLHHACEA